MNFQIFLYFRIKRFIMFSKISSRLVLSKKSVNQALCRNIASSSVVLQKADPIQELFLNKIREYYQKKK